MQRHAAYDFVELSPAASEVVAVEREPSYLRSDRLWIDIDCRELRVWVMMRDIARDGGFAHVNFKYPLVIPDIQMRKKCFSPRAVLQKFPIVKIEGGPEHPEPARCEKAPEVPG